MSDKVILYDLPSKDSGKGCWSLNPWKSKFLPRNADWSHLDGLIAS